MNVKVVDAGGRLQVAQGFSCLGVSDGGNVGNSKSEKSAEVGSLGLDGQ